MRGIEREILLLGPLEQVEFDEAGNLGQVRVTAQPNLFERLLGSLLHAEAVHRDEHPALLLRSGPPLPYAYIARWFLLPAPIAAHHEVANAYTGQVSSRKAESQNIHSSWV